jgi:nitronate monooxygenase
MIQFPKIIQGGMGVGVSNWRLANAVSKTRPARRVSPARRSIHCLCAGSPMATLAGTCAADWMPFPFPRWPGASGRSTLFPAASPRRALSAAIPMHQRKDTRKVVELCIVSNFVEVFLAREGHKNPVGINFLEKVQMPHLWRRSTARCWRAWAMC